MKLTKEELQNYYNGLQKTIDLNMKLLKDGVVEPEALAEELEQLEKLMKKLNKALQAIENESDSSGSTKNKKP